MTPSRLSQPHAAAAHRHLDVLGVLLSGICVLHCLALPIFATLAVPWLTYNGLWHTWVHIGLATLVIPLGGVALWRGYLHHRNKIVLRLGLLGFALILLVLFIELIVNSDRGDSGHNHWQWSSTWMTLLSIGAGSLLIVAHVLNLRLCRKCHHHLSASTWT